MKKKFGQGAMRDVREEGTRAFDRAFEIALEPVIHRVSAVVEEDGKFDCRL